MSVSLPQKLLEFCTADAYLFGDGGESLPRGEEGGTLPGLEPNVPRGLGGRRDREDADRGESPGEGGVVTFERGVNTGLFMGPTSDKILSLGYADPLLVSNL